MKILITGGNGYVGSSLYAGLRDKFDVTVVTRNDFDVSDSIAAARWIEKKYFDVVIHTAIVGGSRLKKDDSSVLDNNIKMYYNLLENRQHFGRFINIGSGAELYNTSRPYGLSKHVIRHSILGQDNSYNIRVFAVFDENELGTRFIKANLLRYIAREPILIHNNMRMDFFYMQDFISIIEHYITTSSPRKEFNCVYEHSYYLQEIAEYINSLGNHTVDIKHEMPPGVTDYIGRYTPIDLNLVGLHQGITNVYNSLLCK